MFRIFVTAAALLGIAAGPAGAHAIDKTKLPIGDGKYLSQAKRGYVYTCRTNFPGGGPSGSGPWINSDGATWDLTEKIAVRGSVKWDWSFSTDVSGSTRQLSGNGLPPHRTGTFPVSSSDPAYQYDRNPNSIRSSTVSTSLPSNPQRTGRASCIGGQVGVMKNGVRLFSAFDAAGRDAAAREVQDSCEGHPQQAGQYHYHSLSSCIKDKRTSKKSHSSLIGWALDGFGIYGQYGQGGERMVSSSLDACHGHTHRISWNGKRVKMFHYHATLDFPYFVSCYRGTAIAGA